MIPRIRNLYLWEILIKLERGKVDLQKAGYNPKHCDDPLFVLDKNQASYVPYSDSALVDLGVQPFS